MVRFYIYLEGRPKIINKWIGDGFEEKWYCFFKNYRVKIYLFEKINKIDKPLAKLRWKEQSYKLSISEIIERISPQII